MDVLSAGEAKRMDSPLLEIVRVKKYYPITSSFVDRIVGNKKQIHALNGITLSIGQGETVGLVGESGCGKSTLGRIIVGLEKPNEGYVKFFGKRIDNLTNKEERRRFCRKIQMVFQNPSSTLDPRMTVKQILSEPFEIHGELSREEREKRIDELLEMVGMHHADVRKYSGEFSDGQRQRISLIRALALNPEFIIADEPVSALDVSVQAQILNLIKELTRQKHLTMLFISHDLLVVRFLCDRIVVIYLGKIVEMAQSNEFFNKPLHPYSGGLLSSVLDVDPDVSSKQLKLGADVPVSQMNLPTACIFQLKCPYAREKCRKEEPELVEVSPGHWAACFFA
jgi:oligopeptide/dipeptide ABC transporter ATP-binding protein